MNRKPIKIAAAVILLISFAATAVISCRTSGNTGNNSQSVEKLTSNLNGRGVDLQLMMKKGKSFNHPTLAIWVEDTAGNFIQDLFVTRSFATGTFTYGDKSGGSWKPGPVSRPAALPYWSHKKGASKGIKSYVPDPANSVADAYTGPTPQGSFDLETKTNEKAGRYVKILVEINQTWDWNEYWNNSKFPDNDEYKTSCQPAVVYSALVDLENAGETIMLTPVGRSHYSGEDGNLYPDLNTLTTALHIFDTISVKVVGSGK